MAPMDTGTQGAPDIFGDPDRSELNSRDTMALGTPTTSWASDHPHEPQATRGDGRTLCGNPRHPNGPWHPATPLPFYVGWLSLFTRRGWELRDEMKRYELRKSVWGCGCRASVQ